MHLKNPLRLDEERILVEQLRLLLGNVGSSVIPAFLLALLMFWVLANDGNRIHLVIWCALVLLSKLNSYRMARNYLEAGIPLEHLSRLVKTLILVNTFDGVLWGALTWITLDSANLTGSILVISVVGGVAGSAMSLLAPVLPAFVGFVVTELVVVVIKLWMLGNPAYSALGMAGVIYLFTLLVQGFNSARAARASIELQFENRELLEQLRTEKESAEKSQHQAEQANAAKSKFLAAASHDLRQPVHAQGLFLEVLAHTEMTSQQRELLSNARAASEASSELLNALLDYSRIEAGVIEPHLQSVKLQPIFHKIENELASQADAKNIIYRSRDTQVSVRSDPVLLELILRNLVSNAIRYTQSGGVLIACRLRSGFAVIEVWDTGIGIPLEHQKDVFMEFHQLGNPERDRNKGLGLGLAIAHRLAQTLDHPLSLSSVMARGSVFKLSVPLAPEIPARSRLQTELNPNINNRRILVIDDDEIVRAGMLSLIRSWGYQCEAVDSIEAALMSARSNRPDMIISDYRLREQRTGGEAIASLRAQLGESLPALIITGDTAPERLREAEQSGIPLLHKPVSPDQLHRKLNEILSK